MPSPTKPIALIKAEGNKRHLTKAEIELREKGEQALLTGTPMKEWPEVKANPEAHKNFMRTRKLLKAIDHDDALHEPIINRYCMLIAECKEFEDKKPVIQDDIANLRVMYKAGDVEGLDYLKQKDSLESLYMAVDKKIMEKRKMLLDIEKESIMTIASALRAIPKKVKDETDTNPMAAYLNRKQQ